MKRMKKELVPPAELRRSKDHITGNLILSLETSDELAGFYGGQEIVTKKFVAPERYIKEIQNVSAEEIRRVAAQIFTDANLNLAVIGPYKKPDSFKKLLTLGS